MLSRSWRKINLRGSRPQRNWLGERTITFSVLTATTGESDRKYARGWCVRDNGKGNWWHNGSLPGTTSIMVRTENGMGWGALTNMRTQPSSTINTALDQMVWDMVPKVPVWNS